MKKSILTLIISVLSLLVSAQETSDILQIKESFKAWQPVIASEINSSTQLFHYAWGENYQDEKWYKNEQSSGDKFLYQKVQLIETDDLGTYVHCDNYSMSGDWFIAVDYYFDTENKLYFVFWRMNTFQALEPLSVEKRLYFNTEGELIRNLQSTYKINTKEASTAEFADRSVEYELQLNEMGFYNIWQSK